MSYHYVVTAHKPTRVTHAVVGTFTSPTELNLIICKCTRLEIHTLSSDGLQPVYDVPIYGRVATLFLWRPAGEQTDLIFLTTERFQFCVLAFEGGKIVTRANGDLRDNVGRPAEHAAIAIIDPRCRLIALRIYDGLLKLIPIGPAASGSASAAASSAPSGAGALREPFNVRLEESTVIDLCFLAGLPGPPVLAVLYQDANEARNVRTYKVIAAERDLAEGPWAELHVEQGASMLVAVPLPFGGVLVVGEQQVTYLSAATSISVPMAAAQIRAACKVDADGRRWLLGDESGALSLLVLHTTTAPASGAAPVVAALQLQPLGVTSAPSALAYLDSGLVFVGSAFGDSQLIRLAERGADEGPAPVERAGAGRGRAADCFEVLEVMPNLGPIQDFCVVDLERQGQGQVVCCSGAGKDGSLRILRNGIGIDEHASVELAGIKGLWALRDSSAAAHDSLLVLSFLKESRVLSLRYDELEEAALPGFETAAKTLLCANLAHDLLLQICAHAIQLIACEGPTPRARWAPPDGRTICVAAADGVEIVVALSSPPELVLLRANPDGSLVELARAPLAHEASCLALSNPSYGRPPAPPPKQPPPPGGEASAGAEARVVAVGLWSQLDVLLLALPSLAQVASEPLRGDVMARSLLFVTLGRTCYLLCGMGDGHVVSHVYTAGGPEGTPPPQLAERKSVPLGTQPVTLTPFTCRGARYVFCASDRPTILSKPGFKLHYASVNAREALYLAPFSVAAFPDALALAGETALTIGNIDNIQKLHPHTVALGEHPRRIAHDDVGRCYAVCTIREAEPTASADGARACFVRLFDDMSFERLDSHALGPSEEAWSILCCTLVSTESGAAVRALVVGTALVDPMEPEPTQGRILVLTVADGRLQLVGEATTKGAVYALAELRGRVVAGINNRIELYGYEEATGASALAASCLGGALRLQHCHTGHIIALYVEVRGDFIIVGDMMKSVSLHVYRPETNEIDDLARDYNANWLSALEAVDDDVYIASESYYNLFVVRKNAEASTDEERQRLEVVGEFHLGEFVNRFRRGALTMQLADGDAKPLPTLLFGTVNGAIGVIAQLPEELYLKLAQLQMCLVKCVHGIGGLKHATWRSFHNERKTSESSNFIDGDLVESFLELELAVKLDVCAQLETDYEELSKLVDELARLH